MNMFTAALCATTGLNAVALGDLITYSFTGEVTVVQSFGSADLSDDFVVGQSVTGYFILDNSVLDTDGSINAGRFDQSLKVEATSESAYRGQRVADSFGIAIERFEHLLGDLVFARLQDVELQPKPCATRLPCLCLERALESLE